eukprot:m51a1_g9730 hypothetical protein (928) ;mRNA; r:1505388-1508745
MTRTETLKRTLDSLLATEPAYGGPGLVLEAAGTPRNDPHLPGWSITTHEQRTADGLPVIGARLKVVWNERNEIVSVTGTTVPNAVSLAGEQQWGLLGVSTAARAAALARAALESRNNASSDQNNEHNNGSRRHNNDAQCYELSARRVVYTPGMAADEAGESVVAWEVQCGAADVYVDARMGATLAVRQKRSHFVAVRDRAQGDRLLWSDGDAFPTTNADLNSFLGALLTAERTWKALTGRDSYDGKGSLLTGYMNDPDSDGEGPYYFKRALYIGGGGWMSDTVVMHEYAHGITEYTDGLWYEAQSGALNEAWSDIFAMTIDSLRPDQATRRTEDCTAPGTSPTHTRGTQRWILAHDCHHPECQMTNKQNHTVSGLRDLWQPACYGDSDSVENMYCGGDDNGGNHWNSLIPGRLFAVFADGRPIDSIKGVGVEAAIAVFTRAKFLGTPMTTFAQSASNLRIACSQINGTAVPGPKGVPVAVPSDACESLDAAIALVHFDDPVDCASRPAAFVSQRDLAATTMLVLERARQPFAFAVSGRYVGAMLQLRNATLGCSPAASRDYHVAHANASNPVWTRYATCPVPDPFAVGIAAPQAAALRVFLRVGPQSALVATLPAFFAPRPVVRSVALVGGVVNASVAGLYYDERLQRAGVLCGRDNCVFACVCSDVAARPADSAACECADAVPDVAAQAVLSEARLPRGDYVYYVTQHGGAAYSDPALLQVRNAPADVELCFAVAGAALDGVNVTVEDALLGAVSKTTGPTGCVAFPLEQGVDYAVSAAREGFGAAQLRLRPNATSQRVEAELRPLCGLTFSGPLLPTFAFHSWRGWTLNNGNDIRRADGSPVGVCLGGTLEYLDGDEWRSDFVDALGVRHGRIETFYALGAALRHHVLPFWMRNLPQVLQGRLLRLRTSCDFEASCLMFRVDFAQ